MDTQTLWKNKFSNNVDAKAEDATMETEKSVKGTMTYQKGAADASRANAYGATNFYDAKEDVTVIKDEAKAAKKKHWWNKSK